MDIAAAQQLLDAYGKIDRIEVTVGAYEEPANVERLVRASVPSTYEVSTPGARSEQADTIAKWIAKRWR